MTCRNPPSGFGGRGRGVGHFGGDETGEGDDHFLPLGGEALRILERELRLLNDLVQLGKEILLVHFRSHPRSTRTRTLAHLFPAVPS
jgi:hypothetical protein